MQTIVLDYCEGKVKIIQHRDMQIEKLENLLFNKYCFRSDEIEWMTVKEIEIEY